MGACVRMLHANVDEHAKIEVLTGCDDDAFLTVPARGMVGPQKMNQGRTRARLATLTDGQSLTNVPVCSLPMVFRPVQERARVLCERIADGLHCYLSGASPEAEGHLVQRIYTAVQFHAGFAQPCPPLVENASGDNDTGTVQS